MNLTYTIVTSMQQVNAEDWLLCAVNAPPFLSYEFFTALEESQSVGADSGWELRAMLIWQGKTLVAIVPMYEKSHSYGEYVFDHAWANAYQQHQLSYYCWLPCPSLPLPLTKSWQNLNSIALN